MTEPHTVEWGSLTLEESRAVTRLRDAGEAVIAARQALDETMAARWAVLREEWATVEALGAARVARLTGGALSEGIIRQSTADLARLSRTVVDGGSER